MTVGMPVWSVSHSSTRSTAVPPRLLVRTVMPVMSRAVPAVHDTA